MLTYTMETTMKQTTMNYESEENRHVGDVEDEELSLWQASCCCWLSHNKVTHHWHCFVGQYWTYSDFSLPYRPNMPRHLTSDRPQIPNINNKENGSNIKSVSFHCDITRCGTKCFSIPHWAGKRKHGRPEKEEGREKGILYMVLLVC